MIADKPVHVRLGVWLVIATIKRNLARCKPVSRLAVSESLLLVQYVESGLVLVAVHLLEINSEPSDDCSRILPKPPASESRIHVNGERNDFLVGEVVFHLIE